MLKDLKFQYKILIFPLLFIAIFITFYFVSKHFDKKNDLLIKQTKNIYLPSIKISIKLSNNLSVVQRSLQDAVASADEEKLEETDTLAKQFTNLCLQLKEKTNDNSIDSVLTLFSSYYLNAKMASENMIAADFTDELSEKITTMLSQYNELDSTLTALEQNSEEHSNLHFNDILQNNQKSANTNIIIIIIGIITFLLVSYFISRAVVNPLQKAIFFINKISQKQIGFQILEKRKDEIGELYSSINEINKNFIEIITKINETTFSVLNAGEQLSSISLEIAKSANKQAATTEEISTSMEEILAMISSNTENAEITGKTTEQSVTEMKESNEIFIQTIESVAEISGKIGIIAEIAEKTDMLSINAAIEAARAGEVGKGFSIVAGEIRKLADKTKIASEEINKLSKNGQDISKVAGEKLAKAIPEIIKSADLVSSIVTASREQQSGVEMINISMQELSEITNSNSASAEEMSVSAEQLSTQAEQLKNLISVFDMKTLENNEKIFDKS